MLITFAAFGALRGIQQMRAPLWIAGAVNALNIVLDYFLIFGFGPLNAMGVGGAALASSVSQWIGALWAAGAAWRALGRRRRWIGRACRGSSPTAGTFFFAPRC